MKSSSQPAAAPPMMLLNPRAAVTNRFGRWFLVAWLSAMVDGRLLVAIAVSTLTYQLLSSDEQIPWHQLQPLYRRLRHQMARLGQSPLLASSLAFATTYGFVTAWSQLGGGWTVLTILGLGLGNGLFLLKESKTQPIHTCSPSNAPRDGQTPYHWDNLSSQDPLKRLLAVRSLTHQYAISAPVAAQALPGTDVTLRSHLIDCLRIMLRHEPEPRIRVAIVDGLRSLAPHAQLPLGQPPISPLQSIAYKTQIDVHRPVEYVEP